MNGKLQKYLFLFVLLLITGQIFGQKKEVFKRTDVVYLKNGSIFRGQIESYEIGKELKLKLDEDRVVIFDTDNIRKIVQEPTAEEQLTKAPKPYAFKENGIFILSQIGYIGGNNLFGNYTNAFNLHLQGGYQFNRFLGTGIGAGIDFYNTNLGSIIPIYATVRGYSKRANVSPYYQLAAGFGIPVKNENTTFTDSKGGYYVSPELGIRVGASAETNMTIGIGLQWQKAQYTQAFEDGISKIEDDYTFRRFNFKIGVLF